MRNQGWVPPFRLVATSKELGRIRTDAKVWTHNKLIDASARSRVFH